MTKKQSNPKPPEPSISYTEIINKAKMKNLDVNNVEIPEPQITTPFRLSLSHKILFIAFIVFTFGLFIIYLYENYCPQ